MQRIQTRLSPPRLPEQLYSMLGANICDILCQSGAPHIEELRLHAGRIATVTCASRNYPTSLILSSEELGEIFRRLCGSSLYTHRQTISQGYVTLRGGIRVGICGHASMENGSVMGVRDISGLILRIPHIVSVETDPLLPHLLSQSNIPHSMLLYAPPSVGKTTLLASLTRVLSSYPYHIRTVVIDTNEELGALLDGSHYHLDILSGFPRRIGMEIAVRNLGAQLLICDEIGNEQDADAILFAANCGVSMLATTHAAEIDELLQRPLIQRLLKHRPFKTYVGIHRTSDNRFIYRITTAKEAETILNEYAEKGGLICSEH